MNNLSLVDVGLESMIPEQIKMKRFEPAFSSLIIENDRDLIYLSETARSKMLSYYDREVARDPLSLENHFRRIALYAKQNDSEGVYSAVLDLFSAVQMNNPVEMEAGLASAKNTLLEQDYLSLLTAVAAKDLSGLRLPEKAILAKGFNTGLPLVK